MRLFILLVAIALTEPIWAEGKPSCHVVVEDDEVRIIIQNAEEHDTWVVLTSPLEVSVEVNTNGLDLGEFRLYPGHYSEKRVVQNFEPARPKLLLIKAGTSTVMARYPRKAFLSTDTREHQRSSVILPDLSRRLGQKSVKLAANVKCLGYFKKIQTNL